MDEKMGTMGARGSPDSKGDEKYATDDFAPEPEASGVLSRNLQGRHMQMIAIGMQSLYLFSVCIHDDH